MGGGLMQLVAYGAQDIYLTGNPQITFFKVVYRRHTNFSMEAIEQTLQGTIGTGASTATATISRNGDLVGKLWIEAKINTAHLAGTGNHIHLTNNTGHAFLKECEIEIGGQRIDRHYSQWLDIWNELTDHDEEEWLGLNKHKAKNAYLKSGVNASRVDNDNQKLFIPLKFWFCRNTGLALPLIALQYHEVNIKIKTRAIRALLNSDLASGLSGSVVVNPEVKLWADYIYLDTDERRRFAQVSHEYLIEQLQRVERTATKSIALNFNHPVKELMWVIQADLASTEDIGGGTDINAALNLPDDVTQNNDYFCYLSKGVDTTRQENISGEISSETFSTLKLLLNGHDRFAQRNASYFRLCQPIQAGHKVPTKHVYCYSFALKPEEHQPSGTCNFSRIDTANMIFGAVPESSTISVYAINYNVLRIMSGMGGLAYSN